MSAPEPYGFMSAASGSKRPWLSMSPRRRPSHGRWYRPSELPMHHDPFDRLLVAAALGATPTILTPDEGSLNTR